MSDKQHVLIIDDDPSIRKFVGVIARRAGYDCTFLGDASGLGAALDEGAHLIFLDLHMPGVDGVEALRLMSEKKSLAAVVLISGADSRVLATAAELGRALHLRVVASLQKPVSVGQLQALFDRQTGGSAAAPPTPRAGAVVTPELLSAAIREDQLVLHFQPQIEIATRRLTGAEGLVRWKHPDGSLVYPDAFIGLAEEEGLIDALGWTVFRLGLSACKRFQVDIGPVGISLNVSARSLHDLEMPDKLAAMVDAEGLARSSVTLEITESGLAERLVAALDILTRLRMKEFRLAIDDFGTGFSMMQQLRRVPATELKIDRSFVQEAATDATAEVVVRKTIEIGHDLGMRVVAEGVETREQLAFLEGLGCDDAQGYLFCRPIPMAEFLSWAERYGKGIASPA